MTQKEYESEVDILNAAAEKYYRGEETGISDYDYDIRIKKLGEVEAGASVVIRPDSPTQKVNGGEATDKVSHYLPMLSLKDVFNMEDLKAWVGGKTNLVVEPKIDGLSIEFHYHDGKFVKAVTRGNGLIGEDVTEVANHIADLPRKILLDNLVVRGEVYMTKSSFQSYKEKFGKAANARNLAAGILRRKSDVEKGEYLSVFMFRLHHLDDVDETVPTSQSEAMELLRRYGFNTVSDSVCKTWEEVEAAIKRIHTLRPDLAFGIDGAVVKINDFDTQTFMGDNGTTPHWAVAYKYPPEEASTKVIGITYQLGKTGKLTPVAELEPVQVDGSTVSRCTLHNKKRMQQLDIRIGDRVYLYKSGDIIPAIDRAERTEDSQEFSYPTVCPVCGEHLDGETCVNKSCKNLLEIRVHHWVSKAGIDIKGVSSATIQALLDKGRVKTVPDIYSVTPTDLYLVPGMGPTKIRKTMTAIIESKKRPFDVVLRGLCIDGLGATAARKLAEAYPTWDAVLAASADDIYLVIKHKSAQHIYDELHSGVYQEIIKNLREIYPF